MKKRKFHNNGFTLVELLVALMVCVITLTAVVALAFAMGSADDSSNDTSQKQAQLRHATINVSELIRYCRLVVVAAPDQVAVWRADDDKNNRINLEEVVYIDRGPGGDCLQLVKFTSMNNPVVSLLQIRPLQQPWWTSIIGAEASFTVLIPACNNVRFFYDSSPTPPNQTQIKSLSIAFNIFENGVNRNYQINASLRNWAGNLLSPMGDMIVIDDD